MIFIGEPNLLVRFNKNRLKLTKKKYIRFDNDGKYETDNPRLIKLLSAKFKTEADIEKPIESEQAEKIKEEIKVEELTFSDIEEPVELDFDNMARQELFEHCKARGIEQYSTMKTVDIRELLKDGD